MSSKPGFWRKCRFAFRCARFTVWGSILILLGAFAWLNTVGLPNFLKTRLVEALHERGVQLEFSRMRWRVVHGIICDNVRIGETQGPANPELTAREVQLQIDFPALLHFHWQVDGLVLRQGKFLIPLGGGDSLAFTNLQGDLRIEPDDTWSLDQFRGDLAGATINLAGEIDHAPEFRNWKMFAAAKSPDHGSVQSSLENFSQTLKQIHFAGKTQLNVRLNGDAKDVHSFTLTINARAPGVHTPWFEAHDLEFAARVRAPTNAPAAIDPAWGFWTNLQPFRIDWIARGRDLKSAELSADSVDTSGYWRAPECVITKLSSRLAGGPLEVAAKLNIDTRRLDFSASSGIDLHAVDSLLPEKIRDEFAQVTWSQPPHLTVGGQLLAPSWVDRPTNWLNDLEPSMHLNGEMALTNVFAARVGHLDFIHTHFTYDDLVWRAPDLDVAQGQTQLGLAAEESEATKDFRCTLQGQLDTESVRPFLTTTNAGNGFQLLAFHEPIKLRLEVAGNWQKLETLSVTGQVAVADFAIRGEHIDSVTTALYYTNLMAEFYHPQLTRAGGAEHFAAEGLTLDVAGEKLFLHKGSGHVSLVAVGEAIGPKTAEDMEPYHFLTIPEATVDGCIPLKQRNDELVTDDADLWVKVVGTAPFRWRRFETPGITGTIHWLGRYLILTNVSAECYGGTAHGWANFDVETPGAGTDFSFFMEGTNVDFNAMGKALWSPTNQLRGELSGSLMMTSANSDDWRTWNGYGDAQLHNGLIWNAPIFGLMSPVLNTLTPGLDIGNSRATDAAGRFTMTNGIIHTDSLEIRSLTMRLDYVGTVDLQENVKARVRSQLLRNTPIVGSLFSVVLSPVSKVFECEVTGTLEDPKISPVYIPFSHVLTAPLHPIRMVQKIFSTSSNTNAPAKPDQGDTTR